MKFYGPLTKLFSTSQFIVAAVMLLLLPLLAALQYRWLGQLSASESEQMKTRLRAVTTRLGQDFDHELARAYLTFAIGADISYGDEGNAYATCYSRWLETAAYPGLIKSVWLAQANEQGQLQLNRLDRDARLFAAQTWPPEMLALRGQLEEQVIRLRSETRLPLPVVEAQLRERSLDDLLPALVLPLLEFADRKGNRFGPTPDLAGFVIITLDLVYIEQELLPALTARNLIAVDSMNYELTVVSQGGERLIYRSGPSAGSSEVKSAQVDSSAPLFSLRADDVRSLMRSRGGRPGPNMGGPPPGPRPRFTPGPGSHFGPPPGPRRFTPLRSLEMSDSPGRWQVQIRHRAGSLDTAIAQARRRNLLISFGILALLAGSVALLIATARRARRLAAQQMDFVAGVSHELRTPLAVIDSAAYNLDKGVVKDAQQIQHYGALIRRETDRLKEMIEQVLEFAGAQTGRRNFDLRPTSIESVIDDALASSQPLLTERGFLIEVDVAPSLPQVAADRAALVRAVQNLLNNAMKYNRESRWIGLRVEEVREGKDQTIQITITDRGLGIPAEELTRIFEPFYRGSEARAAQIRGNGLGLSLVKNIVTAHRGTISVKSTPGVGSSFVIILPAMAPTTEKSAEPSAARSKLSYE